MCCGNKMQEALFWVFRACRLVCEEFSGEGEGVAYTLLCVLAFVVVILGSTWEPVPCHNMLAGASSFRTQYVVHWPDDGVRYYGWIVIGAQAADRYSALLHELLAWPDLLGCFCFDAEGA